jgi:GNAT superfamily N-acetyltransferase
MATKSIQQINPNDNQSLQLVFDLEKEIFPSMMQTEEEEIKHIFSNKNGIYFFIVEGNDIVGYISATPHNDTYKDLFVHDKNIHLDNDALYLESIGVKPAHRGKGLAIFALRELMILAKSKGYKKITMHARISSGFSSLVKNYFGTHNMHHLDNWYDFGEAFDYLEIEL